MVNGYGHLLIVILFFIRNVNYDQVGKNEKKRHIGGLKEEKVQKY